VRGRIWLPPVIGAVSGVATELAIVAGPLRLLTVFAGVWVLAAAWIGRRATTPRSAAVDAALFLAAMVCAFYLTVIVAEGQLRTGLWLFWFGVALAGGPLLGLAGHQTRLNGARAGFAAAGIAGLLAAEGVGVGIGFGGRYRLLFAVFDMVAALIVLLRWPPRGTRQIAAAVFFPALLAGAVVFAAIPVLVYGHGSESAPQWHGPGGPAWSHHHRLP
jgi:Family of unknown function (DUF6518)